MGEDPSTKPMAFSKKVLFVAGVPKCGTDSLCLLMNESDEVDLSVQKEPNLFCFEEEEIDQSLDWYRQLFDRDKEVWLDGSVLYSGFFERASRQIQQRVEEPRVLMTLRDPATRAYSQMVHMNNRGLDKREFQELVHQLEIRTNDKSLVEAERELVEEAYENDQVKKSGRPTINGKDLNESVPDLLRVVQHFRFSRYSPVVEHFEREFGDNFMFFFSEELWSNPGETLERISDFTGVDFVSVYRDLGGLPRANQTSAPSNKLAEVLIRLNQKYGFGKKVLEALEVLGLREWFVKDLLWDSPKPELTETCYQRARALLRDEYAYWEKRCPETKDLWEFPS